MLLLTEHYNSCLLGWGGNLASGKERREQLLLSPKGRKHKHERVGNRNIRFHATHLEGYNKHYSWFSLVCLLRLGRSPPSSWKQSGIIFSHEEYNNALNELFMKLDREREKNSQRTEEEKLEKKERMCWKTHLKCHLTSVGRSVTSRRSRSFYNIPLG